jgi:hypothetical protein
LGGQFSLGIASVKIDDDYKYPQNVDTKSDVIHPGRLTHNFQRMAFGVFS